MLICGMCDRDFNNGADLASQNQLKHRLEHSIKSVGQEQQIGAVDEFLTEGVMEQSDRPLPLFQTG